MKLSDINPHIRYASVHYNLIAKPSDSICYDCRLFFVKEGNGTIIANGKSYKITNNTVIYFPPGTQYHIYRDKHCTGIAMVIINFDLVNHFCHLSKSLGTASVQNYVPEKLITYDLPEEFSTPFAKTSPEFSELLYKCCDEFLMQPPLYRETASALLKLFLTELMRKYAPDNTMQKVSPILEYIHTNYHDADLTNENIAKKFNYHPYYLSQMMKECTGMTLHQYLTHYRIKTAQKNLITTYDTINVIAWKSGFRTVAYFIKTFKEQVGVTPKKYRKEHQQFLF